MSEQSSTKGTTITHNGNSFTIPDWMREEGVTANQLRSHLDLPADAEHYRQTRAGHELITNDQPVHLADGDRLGSVTRFTAAGPQINTPRVNEELRLLESVAPGKVDWTEDLKFVRIRDYRLPAGYHPGTTNVLIVVPENYGFGVPLRESYIDPNIRLMKDGEWVEIPHYFDSDKTFSRTKRARLKGWRYMCVEFNRWNPGDTFLTYLDGLRLFLSDPYRYPHQH